MSEYMFAIDESNPTMIRVITDEERGYIDIEDITNPNDVTRLMRMDAEQAETLIAFLEMSVEQYEE